VATRPGGHPLSVFPRTIVVFTGADGSGKSTQVSHLVSDLRSRGYTVSYAHQYEPVTPFMRWIKRRARGLYAGPQPRGIRPEKQRSDLRLTEYATAAWWLVGGWWRGIAHLALMHRSDVAVLDRCFLDEIVRVQWKLERNSSMAWLLMRGLPRPTLVFALETSEATGWERKKAANMAREDYGRKRAVVEATVGRGAGLWRVERIDATHLAPDEIAADIVEQVARELEHL
jgi:thymidylate kinase